MEVMSRVLQGEGPALKDMLESGVLEPYLVKHWGIKLATNAAITVLRVDQVCSHRLSAVIVHSPASLPQPQVRL